MQRIMDYTLCLCIDVDVLLMIAGIVGGMIYLRRTR